MTRPTKSRQVEVREGRPEREVRSPSAMERRQSILEALGNTNTGTMPVAELVRALRGAATSRALAEQVRYDALALAKRGFVDYKAGDVRLLIGNTRPTRSTYMTSRLSIAVREKMGVGRYCVRRYLKAYPSSTAFLDAGSQCAFLAEAAVAQDAGDVNVYTPSLRALNTLIAQPRIRVWMSGGLYDPDEEAFHPAPTTGEGPPPELKWVENANCSTVFLGVSGLRAGHLYCHGVANELYSKQMALRLRAEQLVIPAVSWKLSNSDNTDFGVLERVSSDSGRVLGFTATRAVVVIEAREVLEELCEEPDDHSCDSGYAGADGPDGPDGRERERRMRNLEAFDDNLASFLSAFADPPEPHRPDAATVTVVEVNETGDWVRTWQRGAAPYDGHAAGESAEAGERQFEGRENVPGEGKERVVTLVRGESEGKWMRRYP